MKRAMLAAGVMLLALSFAGTASVPAAASPRAAARCNPPSGARVAKKNSKAIVWTVYGGSRGTKRIWYGCSYAIGKTQKFHLHGLFWTLIKTPPQDREFDISISDRASVDSVGKWHVLLSDWEMIEGCTRDSTQPSIYRASLATGKVKRTSTGVTCDGEEF
jgi:hypothetical protein